MIQKLRLQLMGLLILLLFIPVNIQASSGSIELTEEDKVDYIRWFGVYDDEVQIDFSDIKDNFKTLVGEGSVEYKQSDVTQLLGEPADTFEVGASEFLLYYSMNNTESAILYVQLFSEELASQDQPLENADFPEPYMVEANILIVNESDFTTLKISEEDVRQWQKRLDESKEEIIIDELIEKIGEPSELTYNFEQSSWQYAWHRNSEVVSGLNYLSAEADQDGRLVSLDTYDESDEVETP